MVKQFINFFTIIIIYYFHLGHIPAVNASGKHYAYQYCSSQQVQLDIVQPASHTISYVGSLTTTLKLHFHSMPSDFEYLSVNESTVIKHTAGTFQRNIAIDANEERLSISFTLRKFFGATDFCGYGGIRMFNHLNTSLSYHHKHNFLQAHVPYDDIEYNSYEKSLKKSRYAPICTNDSFIFERKFYLDFGTTYIVIYDFNSIWNIDITLNVHPSKYNAIYNFEHNYCNHPVQVYRFNDFFIHCKLILVRLTKQVPLILQWPRDINRKLKKELGAIECSWPGNMHLEIYHNYRNFRIFNRRNKLCTPNNMIHIPTASNVVEVLLGSHIHNHSVSNAERFVITRLESNCYFIEQSSYAIILTPSSSEVDRCSSSRLDFTESDNSARDPKHKEISDGCVSLDVIMKKNLNVLFFMEPFYNILFLDKWIYYSLIISKGCYKDSRAKIYFQTTLAKKSRFVNFQFTQGKFHYIWYDFSIMGVLMFNLERMISECSAYIELTSAPQRQDFRFYVHPYFKVSIHIHEWHYETLDYRGFLSTLKIRGKGHVFTRCLIHVPVEF